MTTEMTENERTASNARRAGERAEREARAKASRPRMRAAQREAESARDNALERLAELRLDELGDLPVDEEERGEALADLAAADLDLRVLKTVSTLIDETLGTYRDDAGNVIA